LGSRGFTLIEVLIALVILSIAFVWLLNAHGQAIDMATRARFLTTATLLAQERIAQVSSGFLPISTGAKTGDFGEDNPGYAFEESVETTQLAGYLKYSLTVRWGDRGGGLETKFISFISER